MSLEVDAGAQLLSTFRRSDWFLNRGEGLGGCGLQGAVFFFFF